MRLTRMHAEERAAFEARVRDHAGGVEI